LFSNVVITILDLSKYKYNVTYYQFTFDIYDGNIHVYIAIKLDKNA